MLDTLEELTYLSIYLQVAYITVRLITRQTEVFTGRKEENIDNLIESTHRAHVDTTSEVLGKTRKKKKPRMTNGILDLSDRRRIKKRRKEGPLANAEQQSSQSSIQKKNKVITTVVIRPLDDPT